MRLLGVALVVGLVSAAMWWSWLGWDHEYYQVDGVDQGPYRPWQVLGCGLCVVAAAVLGQLASRSGWSVLVLPAAAVVGFAVPWAVDAASSDDSGLWVVGLLLLLVGGGLGLVVVLAITSAITAASTGAIGGRGGASAASSPTRP